MNTAVLILSIYALIGSVLAALLVLLAHFAVSRERFTHFAFVSAPDKLYKITVIVPCVLYYLIEYEADGKQIKICVPPKSVILYSIEELDEVQVDE